MSGATQTAQRAMSFSDSEAINNIIKRTLIVEWGTVKEVLGDGSVVDVQLSVTDKAESMTVVTCVLISPCSQNFAINVIPAVGDTVLVLSPRHYDSSMFEVSENKEVVVNSTAKGYSNLTCLAILYNQFSDTYKNSITVTDEGALTLSIQNKANITLDKDGYLSYTNTADNKTKLVYTSSSVTIQDNNKCSIVSSSEGIVINGKLKIKKGSN